MAQRRQSAPSIVIRGVLGRSVKSPSASQGREDNTVPYSPNMNNQRLSLKFGSHGATLNLSKRKYVMEGKVQLTAGMQTQERYMFLFTDLLLIAKAKSGSNFKLKYRIRVCELWTASCLDEVCELPKAKDTSFVIGWPTTNFVATFRKIHEEKENETPKVVTLKIINRDSTNISHIKMLKVPHNDTAKDVVRNAVKEFGFEENDDQYQLWVTSKKEGTFYPLIGHENPHAIHINHVRDFISANGILPETEITSVAKYENMIEPEIRDRCQFVLKNSRQAPKYHIDLTRRKPSRIKAATPSKSFFHWSRKRSGQRNESSDSGHVSGNSVGSEGTTFIPSSPPSNSPPAIPKLFSLPLGQVCDNAELPSPIATMFDILFRKAPYTTGIFRKSASKKICSQLRDKLNEEIDIDLENEHIHVVAALLKEFLRQIPDSVLDCTMYDKWSRAIRNSSEDEKLKSIRRLLMSLDACNRVLVRRLSIVLNRVASRHERNKMTSHNLALCISPSLLWPLGPASQVDAPIKVTEVTDLLKYFIDYCDEIFDGIAPTDVDWPGKIESSSDNDEEYEGDGKLNVDESVSPVSDDAAVGREFGEEKDDDDESEMTQFSRSLVTRRQFPRRKTGTRIDASTRVMCLSQDSLDNILMDVNRNPSQHTLDDIVLNESEMSSTHFIRKRGKGYVSNDSGFTTLSGEEEENILNRSTTRENTEFRISCSSASNLNELVESTDEMLELSFSGLRRLWAPNLLNIENGQILDDVELNGIEEEQNSPYSRRKSQPVLPSGRSNSVGPHDSINPRLENQSRPTHVITIPVNAFGESNEDHAPFKPKPPTYVRLNDLPSNGSSNFEDRQDTNAEEYEKESRDASSSESDNAVDQTNPSPGTTKLYTSGAMVTVGDVRPPETNCYRPLTLSIHGLGRSTSNGLVINPVSEKSNSSTTTSTARPFYIGDEESSGSTPDVLSSSQEDVFNDWNNQSMNSDRSRERSRTDGDIILDNRKVAPVTRKHKSTTSRSEVEVVDVTFINSNGVANPHERNFSIQKLTENLQQMPNFKQITSRGNNNLSKEPDTPLGRNKSSSVRESRRSASLQTNTYVAHLSKATFQTQTNDRQDHKSQVKNGKSEEDPVHASSQNSFVEKTGQDSSFERGVRSRRGYGRRRISGNITKDAGPNSFSKSLPTSGWQNLARAESDSKTTNEHVPRNSDAKPSSELTSSNETLVRLGDLVNNEETAVKSQPSKHFSRRSYKRNHEKPDRNSYRSMVSTYDNSSISTANHDDGQDIIRVRRKLGIATPPATITEKASPKDRSTATSAKNHVVIEREIDTNEISNAGRTVVHRNSSNMSADTSSKGLKQTITVQVAAPAHYQQFRSEQQVPHTVSHPTVSDNLIFTLSESFAFGNRKSPRSITPDPLSRENSRSLTPTQEKSQTTCREVQHTTKPVRRRRHGSVDRYVETPAKPKLNVHVTSISVRRSGDDAHKTPIKHLEPPKAPKIVPRDKNANDILPFIGIIQSEESYV